MKFLLLLLLSFNGQNSEVANDREKVRQYVEKYFATLSIYMGNSKTANVNQLALLKMHYDEFQIYPCDLFNHERDMDFSSYLILIEESYKNNIKVDYEITNLSKCEGKNNGLRFFYVFVKKTLYYKQEEKSVDLLVSISNSGDEYKINQVEWLSEQSIKNDSCLYLEYAQNDRITDVEKANERRFVEYKIAGDNDFAMKQYYSALESYKAAQEVKQDPYIQNQIIACTNELTCQLNFDAGNRAYQAKDYKRAIEFFTMVSNDCFELKKEAVLYIELSMEKINLQFYEYFVNKADNLFSNKLYKKSKEAYSIALEYFPDDAYAKKMIKECEIKGSFFARQEINKAVRMAEASRKNFAEAFSIMYEFESSDLLTGENYFFMANVLDGNDNNVGNYMGFSVRERYHLAKIYCIKSIEKGYEEAEVMWYDTFNKKRKQ